MKSSTHTVLLAVVLTGTSLLSACGASQPSGNANTPAQSTSGIAGTVQNAVSKARKEIAEGNINIDNGKSGKRVELSPKGDLLIDGTAQPVTPEQRKLLIEYRSHVVEVATAGMDIGLQGADLATKAVAESITGIFSGRDGNDIERRVEAQADKVRSAALKLCEHLPAMMDSQNRLAAVMPEFRPYANLTQSDIDDCREDATEKGHTMAASAAAEASEAAEAAKATTQ